MQPNEILLIENFTYLSIRLEIFGWMYIYIYRERERERENLALNNLRGLIRHKTQTTKQPTNCVPTKDLRLVEWLEIELFDHLTACKEMIDV